MPTWILGSSLNGAQLAAKRGLPYAFASHFAPAMLEEARSIYRQTFRSSQRLDSPFPMTGAGICAADMDQEADYLQTSQLQAFANVIMGVQANYQRL